MKRSVEVIFIMMVIAAICFTLTSCGYNKIMRNHLSSAENYYSCVLEIEEINAYYPDRSEIFKEVEKTDDIDIADVKSVFLQCKVIDSDAGDLSGQHIENCLKFEILKPNIDELLKTDFFDVISVGGQISIKTSIWLYMDGYFNYIAEVQAGEQIYLPFNVGLQNIIDYMNDNKGL